MVCIHIFTVSLYTLVRISRWIHLKVWAYEGKLTVFTEIMKHGRASTFTDGYFLCVGQTQLIGCTYFYHHAQSLLRGSTRPTHIATTVSLPCKPPDFKIYKQVSLDFRYLLYIHKLDILLITQVTNHLQHAYQIIIIHYISLLPNWTLK